MGRTLKIGDEEYYLYSYEDFEKDCDQLIATLKPQANKMFNGVWGPAKGGVFLAGALAYGLDLPFLYEPIGYHTLVVDDIADTGKTLEKFYGSNFVATLFYHRQCSFEPNIWLHEKTDKYIIYPWAKKDFPKTA